MQRLPEKIAERLKPWFPQDFDLNSVQVKSGGFLGAIFGLFYPVPSHPDRLLKDGDTLEVGDLRFSVRP